MTECFFCAKFYLPSTSTASEDFKDTFCSSLCENISLENMEKSKIESSEESATPNDRATDEKTIEKTIGGFKIKIPESLIKEIKS